MAWVSYRRDGQDGVGVLDGDHVVPLRGLRRIDATTDVEALLAAEPDPASRTAVAEVELLPASPAPSKVFCVGLNYDEHVNETGRELPTYPVLFPKYASSLIAADRDIPVPPESHQVDYEAELAVVVGRPGRRIAKADALDHVLGYSVANDVTMRDYQYKTHQWLQGKAWDGCTPLGPWLVRPDEVDLRRAGIRTVVDGVTVQESDLSKLIFDVPTLISVVSEFTALNTGDVILTGTPGGVGYRRDPQLFLHPGTKVSVEVDGVGRIDSLVVAER
ncbi:fumarylacetoacetate hydrolase family protein [Kineococcus rhizosphaerae]|uniref:Acylpyruvate hydrolase n=1 Tax=Kineococcus rhizosphaerae TaxID=559628 RepID=A0A2T0RAV8_9ACTN|nr:fumarylacetoacetate hydrolase family protein [Kineococcus rhizosphaerae]PRY18295.1 acylpyruvate hydrolase [Kineococcus rhizosphaerae]